MEQQASKSGQRNEILTVLICVVANVGALFFWGWLSNDFDLFYERVEEYKWLFLTACFLASVAFLNFRHPKQLGLSVVLGFLATAFAAILTLGCFYYLAFFIIGLG
jgi:hypothetical protein